MKKCFVAFVLLLAVAAGWAQDRKDIVTIQVQYVDPEGKEQTGVLECNVAIEQDLKEIFAELFRQRYPIEKIRPASEYNFDDERSMTDNNTSCYCYRKVKGQQNLSKHATGMAIDINPLYNPCLHVRTGMVEPRAGTKYARNRERWARDRSLRVRVIDRRDLCYRLFREHGFKWGGDWKSKKDYQHFEK